jgi:hypothetical protein
VSDRPTDPDVALVRWDLDSTGRREGHEALDRLVARLEAAEHERDAIGENADATLAELIETRALLPADTVCACLHDTGSRQVRLYERCERCGAFMESDLLDELDLARAVVEAAEEWSDTDLNVHPSKAAALQAVNHARTRTREALAAYRERA